MRGVNYNGVTLTSAIISFMYVGIGTYEIVWNAGITKYLDGLIEDLDLLLLPSHIIGSYVWFIAGGDSDSIFWVWIGQLLNFIFCTIMMTCFLYLFGLFKNMFLNKKLP